MPCSSLYNSHTKDTKYCTYKTTPVYSIQTLGQMLACKVHQQQCRFYIGHLLVLVHKPGISNIQTVTCIYPMLHDRLKFADGHANEWRGGII